MKDYEAVIILQPRATPEKVQEDIQKVKDIITKNNGVIQSEIKWGKRNLTYSIKKKREGYYLLLHFQLDPSAVKTIAQAYRLLEEEVLRFMITEQNKRPVAKVA